MSTLSNATPRQPGTFPGGPIRAWHQVRWLAALFVPLLFGFYVPPDGGPLPFPALPAAASLTTLLVAANLLSMWWARRGALDPLRIGILLAWDAGLVLALQALFAFDAGLSLWVLAIFPIMGGALLWEVRGALLTWLVMLAGSTIIRAGAAEPIDEAFWSSQLFRASILLLVSFFVGSLVREVSGLIGALQRAEHALREQSVRDDLTGIANRAAVHRQLAEAVARAERGGPAPSLLYIDCDNFKSINDRLGHGVGDQALRVVAARLTETTRAGDVPARLSGDEFCVLVQSPESQQGAAQLAQRLRERIRDPFEVNDHVVELAASVGVATWTPGMDAGDLMDHADRAMYDDKSARRRTVVIGSTSDPPTRGATDPGRD